MTVDNQTPAIRYGVAHPDDPSMWEFKTFDTWQEALDECKRAGRGTMVRIVGDPTATVQTAEGE